MSNTPPKTDKEWEDEIVAALQTGISVEELNALLKHHDYLTLDEWKALLARVLAKPRQPDQSH